MPLIFILVVENMSVWRRKKGKLDGKISYRWRGMPVERVQIVEGMSLRRKIGKLDGKCELHVKKCSR